MNSFKKYCQTCIKIYKANSVYWTVTLHSRPLVNSPTVWSGHLAISKVWRPNVRFECIVSVSVFQVPFQWSVLHPLCWCVFLAKALSHYTDGNKKKIMNSVVLNVDVTKYFTHPITNMTKAHQVTRRTQLTNKQSPSKFTAPLNFENWKLKTLFILEGLELIRLLA